MIGCKKMTNDRLPLALTPASNVVPLLASSKPGCYIWIPRLILALIVPGAPLMVLIEWGSQDNGYPRGFPWYISWPSGALGFALSVITFAIWNAYLPGAGRTAVWLIETPLYIGGWLVALNFVGSIFLGPLSLVFLSIPILILFYISNTLRKLSLWFARSK